jgi:hypothetical protein
MKTFPEFLLKETINASLSDKSIPWHRSRGQHPWGRVGKDQNSLDSQKCPNCPHIPGVPWTPFPSPSRSMPLLCSLCEPRSGVCLASMVWLTFSLFLHLGAHVQACCGYASLLQPGHQNSPA